MTLRALVACLLLLPVALLLGGCVLRPDHVTVAIEHDETETTTGVGRQRAAANKCGLSATYDLTRK